MERSLHEARHGSLCPRCRVIARGGTCARCGAAVGIGWDKSGGPQVADNPMLEAPVGHEAWLGARALCRASSPIGTVAAMLIDPETAVRWMMVDAGPEDGYSARELFLLVPATEATLSGDQVRLAYEADEVRTSPSTIRFNDYQDGRFRSAAYVHYGLTDVPRRRSVAAPRRAGTLAG